MSESEVPPAESSAIAPGSLDGAGEQAIANTTETIIPPNAAVLLSTGGVPAESELKDTYMTDVSSDQPPVCAYCPRKEPNPSSSFLCCHACLSFLACVLACPPLGIQLMESLVCHENT